VRADDYGRDPISGELVAASAQEIVIRRQDPQVGEVMMHFPAVGGSRSAARENSHSRAGPE